MSLTPEKLALLHRLRAQRAPSGAAAPAGRLQPRTGSGPVPLSPAQQGLWLVDQLLSGTDRAAYNMGWAVRLRGTLDTEALTHALSEIVRRHEVLRTRFAAAHPLPVQTVADAGPAGLTVRDIAPHDAQAAVRAHLAEPFDLAAGPLLRPLLLRTGNHTHILVLSCHHTVGDGTSIGVFHDELTALYTAYTTGRPSPLPDLEIQYADYALWQRARLDSGSHDADLAYWRERLAGAPALLELPTDRPRPAVASHTGAQCHFTLDTAATAQLRNLARAEHSTPFMVLTAAYQVLLARWTGQPDISIGTPVSGRSRSELDSLIGYFVNTVVLRGRAGPEMSFRDVLAHTRQDALEAFAHQDLPFERLVEDLAPDRTLSHHPLFQTMLVFQNDSRTEPMNLPGLETENVPVTTADAKFDLTLDLVERPDGIHGTLGYRTDLFDAPAIECLAARYVRLLTAVTARPGAPTGTLDLLLPGEKDRLLAQGRGTAPTGTATTLHALVEEQARLTPHAPAVSCDGVELTYRELDTRAAHLAQRLRARGAGPEQTVAVALERSADTVVALLAVLKAGAAYLPVDLTHPPERIAAILEDARPALVLRAADLAPQPATAGTGPPRPAPPHTEATPRHPAYVIHTSGSTGRPKGVVIEHTSAVNLVRWAVAELGADRLAHTLCTTSFTFDVSVFELFAPLACGGRVEILRDTLALAERDPAKRATLVSAVPSALAAVLEHGRLPQGTTTVVLAGEALPGALVGTALAAAPGARLLNAYGPTEATVYATTWSTDRPSPAGAPPIGRPLAATTAQVLDPALRPVPAGVTGELWLGGAGVARGYLHQPALTADRFRPDPYGEPGARMYRTGDLARRTADGELKYTGRADQQVKIRGFRIECGEIETVLCTHHDVAQAAVVAREDTPGDKRLVAYLVTTARTPPRTAEVRAHLARTLPAHMMPSAFVTLGRLPLTPTGKLDRAALPEPDTASTAHTAYEPPRTATEQLVAGIWSQLLRVERVGRHDNFFDLGGHSLHAATMTARLRTHTGTQLPLSAVFSAPTVAELAADADTRRPEPAEDSIRSLDRSRYRTTRT